MEWNWVVRFVSDSRDDSESTSSTASDSEEQIRIGAFRDSLEFTVSSDDIHLQKIVDSQPVRRRGRERMTAT